MARRAYQFVTANNLERIEYALNDALAELALKDAQDIKINMHINLAVPAPFIIGIDYTTNDPWPPPPTQERQADGQS